MNKITEREAALQRELTGVTEMLAHVLAKVGTVEITKEDLERGLDGKQIMIDDNQERNSFIFSLVEAE